MAFDVFISYARDDDEPFVRDLHGALTEAGFSVWWDRVCMPSRALTFLEEIRTAIHASARLIVVIGPNAVVSEYVRAEWQYALIDDKVVVPILRSGDYELLPAELKGLHCADVRPTRDRSAALEEVCRILRDPVPPLGLVWGSPPATPPHFQPRPNDMTRLADTVLIEREHAVTLRNAERATVLHGISGVGKSVLAAAFARATTTRRAFADGVFWLRATEQTEPLAVVRQLGQLLGGEFKTIGDLSTGVSRLRERLADKRYLVVLDNAWRVEQVEPLLGLLGTNARLLITSRVSELASAIGSAELRLECLTEEAALRHLSAWTGQPANELPLEARELARECGYLPFALALNGAMVADGNRWPDLLDALRTGELDFAEKRFVDYPFPNVLMSIQLSVDVLAQSQPEHAARYRELAAYLTAEEIPLAAVSILWAHRGGLKERHVTKLASQLAGKGLLRLETRNGKAYISLHDLQYEVLRATADGVELLNEWLLEAYRASCEGDWSSGPDDGYFHRHLVDHLLLAEQPHEVHRLLSLERPDQRNAWYEAVDAIGALDSYIRDVERAWELAGAEGADDEHVAEQRIASLGLRIKYTLMLASVYSISRNIPLALIVALIDKGEWTLAQAQSYAAAIPDAGERIRAFVALALRHPSPRRDVMLREAMAAGIEQDDDGLRAALAETLGQAGLTDQALELARAISGSQQRASAMGALVGYLSSERQAQILEEAIDAAFATGEVFRPAALAAVSPHLSESMIDSVLGRLSTMKSPLFRDMILADLLPELIRFGRVEEARERALALQDPASQANALAGIVEKLAPEQRSEAIRRIMDALIGFDEDALAERVGVALEHLGVEGLLAGVIQGFYKDTSWRMGVLPFVLPHVSDEEREEIRRLALSWRDSLFKVQALSEIASHFSDRFRREIVQEALAVAARIVEREGPGWPAINALTAILPQLDDETSPGIAQTALELVRAAELWVPDDLVPYLPEDAASQMLDLARPLGEDAMRQALEAVAPRLPADLLPVALSVARSIGDVEDRIRSKLAFAASLDPARVRRCFAEARGLRSLGETSHLLGDLVVLLPSELRSDALELARRSKSAVAIARLASQFAEPERTRLWREATAEAMTSLDADTLREVAAHLPQPLVDEIIESLDAARKSREPDALSRATCLVVLLPRVDEASRPPVLDAILEIAGAHWPDQEGPGTRLTEYGARRMLGDLAPELQPSHLQRALDLAERLSDPYHRAMAIGVLIPAAPPPDRNNLIVKAAQLLPTFQGDRLTDAEFQQAAVAALVIPHMSDQRRALELAGTLDALNASRAIEGLTATLDPELVSEALDLARGIDQEEHRAVALRAIADYLPSGEREPVWQEAFQAALGDIGALYEVCRSPADLSRADTVRLLESSMAALRTRRRWWVLRYIGSIAPLVEGLGPDAADATLSAIEDVGRWWP